MPETDQTPIYLDNHATTRVDPRVVAAMVPFLETHYGNAHSPTHYFGAEAREALESSRSKLAELLGAQPDEIVFTSGATESNNLALRGVIEHPRCRRGGVISVVTEHAAVLDPLRRLAKLGTPVTWLPVTPATAPDSGVIDLQQLTDALDDSIGLVSVMWANNEIGVLQPLEEIGRLARAAGALVHCDATQAIGKLPINLARTPIDLLSCSAHKFHGPKGVGLLWVRSGTPRVKLEAQQLGGGHEAGRRSGTVNVPGIVGMATALELALTDLDQHQSHLRQLKQLMWSSLQEQLAAIQCEVELNGPSWERDDLRLPGNLNFRIVGIDGQTLLARLPWLALSSGAACSSIHPAPSHVLQALGLDNDQIRSSLRVGLSRFNTVDEIDRAVRAIVSTTRTLSAMR